MCMLNCMLRNLGRGAWSGWLGDVMNSLEAAMKRQTPTVIAVVILLLCLLWLVGATVATQAADSAPARQWISPRASRC